jgi:ribonuclease E
MAGLVVIDFIDMDHSSNVRKVEKAMKEALKNDRARIQVGRISSFGLMEMSRQRLRTGVLEASTRACPHCEGTGLVRTASSAGLSALRLLEEEAARGRGSLLTLRASQEATIYVLNRKRADIAEVEDRYGVTIEVIPDREEEGARMSVEASGPPPAYAPKIDELVLEEEEDDYVEEPEIEEEEEIEEEAAEAAPRTPRPPRDDEGEGRGKRRRRRRGRRGRQSAEGEQGEGDAIDVGADEEEADDDAAAVATVDGDDEAAEAQPVDSRDEQAGEGEGGRRRRGRRGRRGGRRGDAPLNGEDAGTIVEEAADAGDSGPVADPLALPVPEPVAVAAQPDAAIVAAEPVVDDAPAAEPVEAAPAPKTRRRPRARPAAPAEAATPEAPVVETPAPVEMAEEPAPKPKRTRRKAATSDAAEVAPAPEPAAEPAPKPKRTRRKPATEAAAAEPVADAPAADTAAPEAEAEASTETPDTGTEGEQAGGTPRRGWWQRTFGA